MADAALRLGLVAGEASGDLLGSLLLQGLNTRWPGLHSAGIGGPRMQAQGLASWWPQDRLSVFGYVDALQRLPELLRIRRQLGDRLLHERPAAFIGIDAPDFNFGLERRLRQGGLKTVHFVCPSIWAWRRERVQTLAAAADRVLCLFPFEPALLQAHRVNRDSESRDRAAELVAAHQRDDDGIEAVAVDPAQQVKQHGLGAAAPEAGDHIDDSHFFHRMPSSAASVFCTR